jgi:hypothetical protein
LSNIQKTYRQTGLLCLENNASSDQRQNQKQNYANVNAFPPYHFPILSPVWFFSKLTKTLG